MNRARANELFEQAIELDQSRRVAFVESSCGDDAALKAEVLSLLSSLDRAGGFLTGPTVIGMNLNPGNKTTDADTFTGSTIGPFKILELIGEGGFGSVYMADQTRPIRRRVAIKVLKAGMDSKQVIARFEAERQALAMMDHPNIARVLDAGTTSPEQGSLPYFVMELVRGVPITQYCDDARLSPRERLALMIPVCQAVQHAHQKGIIHRDIKPSNVLVTLHDGKPVPKVIDFGIAKATGQSLTDKTVFTEFRQLIGTPAYMSPEQAEMSGLDIDTRSDVYSLGVLLYELLTGGPPFETTELLRAGIGEMQRIIREAEPPKPSTRVSTTGVNLVMIADQRRTQPERLGRMMRGELDWIVMRAMEKDRRRRYDTAVGLAGDLERYLSGQPVEAAPPSRVYRATKFVRRNRVAVIATSVVAGALVLGAIGTTWGFVQAAIDRDKAQEAEAEQERLRIIADDERTAAEESARDARQAQQVEAVARGNAIKAAARAESMLSFSDLMIGSANPDVTATAQTTTSQMLRTAAGRAGEFFKDQPEAEFAVRVRIGRAYWAQRDPEAAIEQFRLADAIARQHPNIAAFDRLQLYWPYLIVESMMRSGYSNGPYKRIQVAARDLIQPHHPAAWQVIESMRATGLIWSQLDEARGHQIAEQIEQVIREELRIGTPAAEAGVAMLSLWGTSAARRRSLATDPDGYSRVAVDCFDRVLRMLLETVPESNSHVARVRQRRLEVLYELKEYPRALAAAKEWEEAAEKVLPPDHWMLRLIHGYEGMLHLRLGNAAEAVQLLEPVASGVESVKEIQEQSGTFAENAAAAQRSLGNLEAAERWEKQAAAWYRTEGTEPQTPEVLRRVFSPDLQPLVEAMIRTSEFIESKSPEAGEAILTVINLAQRLCPPEDPAAGVLFAWGCNRIFAYESGRESPGVTPHVRHSLDKFLLDFGRLLPKEPTTTLGYLAYHVGNDWTLDASTFPDPKARLQSSEALLRESIQRLTAFDAEAPYLQLVHSWLGRCLYLQGRYEEALEALGDCEFAIAGESGAGSSYAAAALNRRLNCLVALNRREDARRHIESYMKLDQSFGVSTFYLRRHAQILLQGTGQTREQLDLALAMAREAVNKEPASAANQTLLVPALRRIGSNDEARDIANRVLGQETFAALVPAEANYVVWTLVQDPGVEPALAGKAADALAAVVEKNPKDAAIINTLAVAQYRAGRAHEAAELARVRVKSFKSDGFTTDPTAGDYAVLAMALFRQDHPEEAREALASMPRGLVDGPLDDDDAGLLAEARELLKAR